MRKPSLYSLYSGNYNDIQKYIKNGDVTLYKIITTLIKNNHIHIITRLHKDNLIFFKNNDDGKGVELLWATLRTETSEIFQMIFQEINVDDKTTIELFLKAVLEEIFDIIDYLIN